ncbi:ribbon-helix-helix CopG family protein [Nocardia tenerifensis]|uniref:Ribbon-helix-helix CopG family protein n=1 Tax=Nocardia tenerifensis TaxID=228006 RepID=A0A318KA11_9NOCA|nr:ribbon-helix-helix domain-containing protein [Nocardia tenerifensis]PXX70936.1 ribbon-helix-helix CopG family protein [Nocardia tenerifensis]
MPSPREQKTRKVTVTLPEELLAMLENWRADGRIESVSAFVAEAVQARVDHTQSLAKLEQVLGGRPPLDLINRARAAQGLPPLSEEEAGGPHAGAA